MLFICFICSVAVGDMTTGLYSGRPVIWPVICGVAMTCLPGAGVSGNGAVGWFMGVDGLSSSTVLIRGSELSSAPLSRPSSRLLPVGCTFSVLLVFRAIIMDVCCVISLVYDYMR